MRTGRGATRALLVFEVRRRVHDPGVGAGLLLFLVIVGLDAWGRGSGVLAPEGSGSSFGMAYLAGVGLGLRTGHGTDRAAGFTSYLTLNFVAPWRVAAARTGAAVLYVAAFAGIAAGAAALFGGVELVLVAWRSIALTLVTLAFLPVVAAVELLSVTRFPALVVVLLYLVGGLIWVAVAGSSEGYLSALGLDALEPGSWRSLGPLGARAALGPLLAALLAAWVERRRRGPGLASGLSAP